MLDGKVEIITGRERRRRWSEADKLRIVAEAEAAGACFSHLRHVLGIIADHPVNRIAELLPWAVPGLAKRLDQHGKG